MLAIIHQKKSKTMFDQTSQHFGCHYSWTSCFAFLIFIVAAGARRGGRRPCGWINKSRIRYPTCRPSPHFLIDNCWVFVSLFFFFSKIALFRVLTLRRCSTGLSFLSSLEIIYFENKKPIGIMLNATTNEDDYLLSISSEIEKVLQK